jgi:hypothetical protein
VLYRCSDCDLVTIERLEATFDWFIAQVFDSMRERKLVFQKANCGCFAKSESFDPIRAVVNSSAIATEGQVRGEFVEFAPDS